MSPLLPALCKAPGAYSCPLWRRSCTQQLECSAGNAVFVGLRVALHWTEVFQVQQLLHTQAAASTVEWALFGPS